MSARRFGGLQHLIAAQNIHNIGEIKRGALFDDQTLIIWTRSSEVVDVCFPITPKGLTEDMEQAAKRALGEAPPTPRWQRR